MLKWIVFNFVRILWCVSNRKKTTPIIKFSLIVAVFVVVVHTGVEYFYYFFCSLEFSILNNNRDSKPESIKKIKINSLIIRHCGVIYYFELKLIWRALSEPIFRILLCTFPPSYTIASSIFHHTAYHIFNIFPTPLLSNKSCFRKSTWIPRNESLFTALGELKWNSVPGKT